MKKFQLIKSIPILLIGLTVSNLGYSDSLDGIASFAERICNDVRVEGEISRLEIIGQLEGSSGIVAELVGADIEGNASLKHKKDVFNNLPLDELSDQFSDARACKKEIAAMLVEERKKKL